jgi:hypothetical protein
VTKQTPLIGVVVIALGATFSGFASAKSAPKNTMRAGSALLSTWTDKPISTVIPTQYELKRYAKGDCLVVKISATKTDTWCGTRSSMYGTVDQKIVKFKKSPNTQVKCPQNDQPFEVTAKGAIMHGLYEIEFCEELFGPAPAAAAALATPVSTTTAPALAANAGAFTTTTPLRNGVVPRDSTPVTAVQKAYANDLASISTGQPATIAYENETWYLSRVINGGGARYVGIGGQCIFTITPDKPAGAQPVVTYTPDKCINMDRLIDNWIRFPKTAAVPLPATTTTTAPQFVTNPVINGPEPVTASPVPVIATPVTNARARTTTPSVRTIQNGSNSGTVLISFDPTDVISVLVGGANYGAIQNPIPTTGAGSLNVGFVVMQGRVSGTLRPTAQLVYRDGTFSQTGYSINSCNLSNPTPTSVQAILTC